PPELLNDLGDRLRDVVDVAGVERGNADAPCLDGVDRVLLAQPLHLFLGEARVGEEAALREDEAEIDARRALFDPAHELASHVLDALAHGAEFLVPLRAQLRRREHAGGELAAVRWRIGVIGAHDALELREHAGRFLRARGDEAERAYAFAI